jgi:hypothetical protein
MPGHGDHLRAKSRRGMKTMARVLQRNDAVERRIEQLSAMPKDDRLAPAIGVFNAVCICSVFWMLVRLVAYLLS